MKKIFITILILAIIAVGAFFYLTRPIQAPTDAVQSEGVAVDEAEQADTTTYRVASSESTVSFSANETLNEKPFTAVGTTNQVAADIAIVRAAGKQPEIKVGVIKIDARTFKTDSEKRDGAINRFILKTETPGNEYIIFTPTSVSAPVAIEEGKAFSFTVAGTMAISGITKPSTLSVTATLAGDALKGTVKTSIKRSDYGLKIPEIPFVANVSDVILITGTFTAYTGTTATASDTATPELE